jgi:hypothetical protein
MGRVLTAIAAVALLAASLRAGLLMEPGLDYFGDAGAAIDALVRRDLDGFLASQPLMGSFSLLLRAPFVAPVFYASEPTVYLAGALPCLLATVLLGSVLGRMLAERGQPPAVQGIAAGLAVLNPVTFWALHWGHPEELLAGALCVGAVLAAMREREVTAAVLLGLAVATKQWAVLAIAPVLFAAPSRRLLLCVVAGAVVAALTLPLVLGNLDRFTTVATSASGQDSLGASTTPWNIWWPISTLSELGAMGQRYVAPSWVAAVSHPLIVVMALPLSVLLWRRTDRRPDDALLLLALLLLLRCVLDNWGNAYYHLPMFLALLAWETTRRPGVPRLTIGVGLALSVSFWPHTDRIFAGSVEHAAILNAVYLGWALPLTAWLGLTLLRPATAEALERRVRSAAARRRAVRRPRPA